jgi:hypothetical protein
MCNLFYSIIETTFIMIAWNEAITSFFELVTEYEFYVYIPTLSYCLICVWKSVPGQYINDTITSRWNYFLKNFDYLNYQIMWLNIKFIPREKSIFDTFF